MRITKTRTITGVAALKKQQGFSIVEVFLVVLMLGIVGGVGFYVFNKVRENSSTNKSAATVVTWSYDGQNWQPSSTPPPCPEPLVFPQSPADITKVTAVLYPGQTRGGNYKPHGGLRFGESTNAVTVVAPMEAQLVEGSRYVEQGEVQYLLRFTNPCGVSYRFDHLLKLSPAMQQVADTLPEPKPNESRTTPFANPVTVKAGEVIATEVGFANNKNVGFDFGVYDLRSRNQAAADQAYVAKHQQELSQAGYAVCWFDMLPSPDNETVKNLPAGDMANGSQSDYCN